MARLIGMSSDIKGQIFDLTQEPFSIGRSSDNELALTSPTVSGHHCTITFEDNQYKLQDKGSTNGTRVNARDVTEAVLRPKDLVQVGSVEFLFEDPEAPTTQALSPDASAEVQVEEGPVSLPDSFVNVSPFAIKKRESTGLWNTAILIAGLAALASLALFVFKLISVG